MTAVSDALDRYLLGEPVSKPDVVATLLRERSDDPAAAPFYRAFEAVGARAADEAFVALRLVLAGRAPGDVAVRRVRALGGIARACATDDAAGLVAIFARDGRAVDDLTGARDDRGRLAALARAAYLRELSP